MQDLRDDDKITAEAVEDIGYHASLQGQNICDLYQKLNAIVLRHEQLIRTRWAKMTVAKRRTILLKSWPWPMPQEHRPDDRQRYTRYLRLDDGSDLVAGMFPFSKCECTVTAPLPS